MDWIKRQLKRVWGAIIALIIAIGILVFRLSDEVAPALDDMARAVPPPIQIAEGLAALDGVFITNSRIIQYVPAGNRTLDAALEALGHATDVPWLELVDIYEDIEAHAAFQRTVEELLPIVRAQVTLATLPGERTSENWRDLGLDSFVAPMREERGYVWFVGDPVLEDPDSNLFVFGLDHAGLERALPPNTTLRGLTDQGRARLASNRKRVFHFYALDGQIGYVEQHAEMDGLAYCFVAADAGILQRRSAPATTENLLMLSVMSRVLRDLDETCLRVMPESSSASLLRHSTRNGQDLPGVNAAEVVQLGPLSDTRFPNDYEWSVLLQDLSDPGSVSQP